MNPLFDILKFNPIEDKYNIYFFRALNTADLNDVENEITANKNIVNRIRTDSERFEEKNNIKAKYSDSIEITLEEMWDHIRINYLKETNCISMSCNAKISLDYGRQYQNRFILIKIKKENNNIYNAGQYMLSKIEEKIVECVEKLPKNSFEIKIINKIKNENTLFGVLNDISDIYSINYNFSTKKFFTQKRIKSLKYKRFFKKSYFSNEQELEYNKIIAKLTVLETLKKVSPIINKTLNNDSLIDTIDRAFSSFEVIHYGQIKKEEFIEISKEEMEMFAMIQNIKTKFK